MEKENSDSKLQAGLMGLGLKLADDSNEGIKLNVDVEYDENGNPHIDSQELSDKITEAVQNTQYNYNPEVAKIIKERKNSKK